MTRSIGRRAGLRLVAAPIGVLGLVVGCLAAWQKAIRGGVFDDTFWHRAVGVWILDHHRILTSDVFSYTVPGRHWISPEWGYGVVLAESVRVLGPAAFWLLSAGLATLAVVCVAARARLEGAGWLWTGLLCAEAGVAVTAFLDDRPQVVSYLFVALLLLMLRAARRRRWILACVPVLFVLWANLHGSFLLGLGILLLEAVVAVVPIRVGRVTTPDPLAARAALLTFAGAGLATLVNPFGPAVYESAFGVTFNSTVRAFIGEWQSPDFHDVKTLVLVVAPIVATVAYLAVQDRPVPLVDLVLAGGLLVMTLDASRFLPYFAIAWCGLAARTSPIAHETLTPSILTWPVAVVLGFGMLSGSVVPAGRPAPSVPVAAVSYLQSHPGRVFATYLWNDYLDWEHIPVFIDGRTEIYTGTPVFRQYLDISNLTVDPDPILASYGVRYVLWTPGTPLAVYLAHDPRWTVVRRSQVSLVFRRVAAPSATASAS
ncbi:MAG TPA: hypothetical protein VE991_10850 [Acidimicrobiales bacterium]|nr:hypothetical protein [Acidimicrobiales bacterium]